MSGAKADILSLSLVDNLPRPSCVWMPGFFMARYAGLQDEGRREVRTGKPFWGGGHYRERHNLNQISSM